MTQCGRRTRYEREEPTSPSNSPAVFERSRSSNPNSSSVSRERSYTLSPLIKGPADSADHVARAAASQYKSCRPRDFQGRCRLSDVIWTAAPSEWPRRWLNPNQRFPHGSLMLHLLSLRPAAGANTSTPLSPTADHCRLGRSCVASEGRRTADVEGPPQAEACRRRFR